MLGRRSTTGLIEPPDAIFHVWGLFSWGRRRSPRFLKTMRLVFLQILSLYPPVSGFGWCGDQREFLIGHRDQDPAAHAARALDFHLATQQLHPLADTEQPESGGPFELPRVEPASPIHHRQIEALVPTPHADGGLINIGVLDHIEQQLLRDPVKESLHGLRRRIDLAAGLHLDDQAMSELHVAPPASSGPPSDRPGTAPG